MIEVVRRYTRAEIKANPDKLYVFGDNMARVGLGGQAKEARGEPNSVGIPTKWRPGKNDGDYFSNQDWVEVVPAFREAFAQLNAHVQAGGVVASIYALLEAYRRRLFENGGT